MDGILLFAQIVLAIVAAGLVILVNVRLRNTFGTGLMLAFVPALILMAIVQAIAVFMALVYAHGMDLPPPDFRASSITAVVLYGVLSVVGCGATLQNKPTTRIRGRSRK